MAESTKKKEKKKSSAGLFFLVLLLAFLLWAFGRPGALVKDKGGEKAERKNTAGAVLTLEEGNSRGYTLAPFEELTISVPENTMFEERILEVEKLDDRSEEAEALNEALKENDEYLLAAWTLHGGLEDDEVFPGSYTTEYDASYLKLDPWMYQGIRAYRIDSQNVRYELPVEVDGNLLRFECDRNSTIILTATLTLALGTVGFGLYEEYRDGEYYRDPRFFVGTLDGTASGGTYRMIWLPEETDQINDIRRIREIERNYREAAEAFWKSVMTGDDGKTTTYDINQAAARMVTEQLLADEEYQALLSELQEIPQSVLEVGHMIRQAFYFLNSVEKVRMPKYRVCFNLKGGAAMAGLEGGASTKTFLKDPFIDLNTIEMRSKTGAPQSFYDNLLVTITHELFHLCQNEYRFKYFDNEKFDEATAVVLERDAQNYYLNEEIILTGNLARTDDFYFENLSIPMDKNSGPNSETGDLAVRHEGYTYSRFIEYLRKRVGKAVTMGELMEMYRLRTKSFTAPLKKAFDLTEEELAIHFRAFCLTNRQTFLERYKKQRVQDTDKVLLPKVQITPDKGTEVMVKDAEYTAWVREFAPPDTRKYAFLLTPGEGLDSHSEYTAVPLGNKGSVSTHSGLFIPEHVGSTYLLEIFDHTDDKAWESSYTTYMLSVPADPEAEVENKKLVVKLPEMSPAAKAGLIDGYELTVTASDGTVTVRKYTVSAAMEGISIRLRNLVDKDTESAVIMDVRYREFIYAPDGSLCCGPMSGQDLAEAELDDLLEELGALKGDITVSMLWHSDDDLDLHLMTPEGEIWYSNKETAHGRLDVDMQVHSYALSPNPVENIYVNSPPPGTYTVAVHNYCDRTEGSDTPVMIRVSVGDDVRVYNVTMGGWTEICTFEYGEKEE